MRRTFSNEFRQQRYTIPRSVPNLRHIEISTQAEMLFVHAAETFNKRIYLIISDSRDGAAAEARAGHAAAEHAGELLRPLG